MRRLALFVIALGMITLATGCCGSGIGPAPYGTAYNSNYYQPQYSGPVAAASGCNCR